MNGDGNVAAYLSRVYCKWLVAFTCVVYCTTFLYFAVFRFWWIDKWCAMCPSCFLLCCEVHLRPGCLFIYRVCL